MHNRLAAGFLASIAALFVPLLLTGMGQGNSVETAEIPQRSEPVEATAPIESSRTVQAIVIHESEESSMDGATELKVSVEGEETSMSLRDYLVGVLMGEMPASFELEALKAQAVAARTYTLRRLEQGGVISDDPAVCQAFGDVTGAQEKWGENWEMYLNKLRTAVDSTDGQVLTYDGSLITATYFSCSGGKTESAQAVWGGEVPYLVSVTSPGEEEASAYESEVTVPIDEFLAKLGISDGGLSAVTYTQGGGVDTITIGSKTVSGNDMRSLFGLKSTMFDLEIGADTAVFQVRGFGHRVGLSQYGAQAMAEAGCDYEEILKWYYTGVEITEYHGG